MNGPHRRAGGRRATGAGRPVRLLERDDERDAIGAFLTPGGTRPRPLLVVEGEAGIGKSRLLDLAASSAARRGHRTVRGRGTELGSAISFGTALDLVEPLLADPGLDPAELLADAAGFVRVLLDPAHPSASATADGIDAARVAHGLFRLWSAAAAHGPVCLVVDDVHWTDPGTLRALAHAAERATDPRLRIIASIRDGEPGSDPTILRQLRDAASTTVRPRPLSADAIATLAADVGIVDPAVGEACRRLTAGNPLLATALVDALGAHLDGSPDPAPDAVAALDRLVADGVPSVGRHVRRRLTGLPDDVLAVARAAAVLGDGSTLRHVGALAGVDLDAAADAVDRLGDVRLLERATPVAFSHPVVRDALLHDLPSARRALMHGRAARLLADDHADAERVAAHLLRAAPEARPRHVALLRSAAAQAIARAQPASAAGYLRRALEEPPGVEDRPAVLLDLGRALAAAGDAGAGAVLDDVLADLPDGRPRAEVLLLRGRVWFSAGDLAAAARAFDAGLDALDADAVRATADAGPPADDAGGTGAHVARTATDDLALELQAAFISAARFDASLQPEAQRRLEPLLDRGGDGATRAERALLAEVALERGIRGAPPRDAIDLAMRAWADGQVLDELDPHGIVLSQLAATLTWSDAVAESEAVLTAAFEHADRTGAAHGRATAAYLRAWPRLYRGDLAGADADARLALATDGWEMYEPSARAVVALVALERADPDEAERWLDVGEREARWSGSLPYGLLLEARGRLALRRGAAEVARDAFLACGALIATIGAPHPFCPWKPLAALACARAGDRGRAVALAAVAVEEARDYGLARPLGAALRLSGLATVDPATGRPSADGMAALREAVAILGPSPARLERTHALLALGVALHRSGVVDEARTVLRRALSDADALGATAIAERAHAELLSTGLRPRRAAAEGVASLTPGELRVARMAAAGMTNAAIAEAIVVRPKTVQYHLTNVYRKLGVAGRDGLAPALAGEAGATA
ncbi:MAG: AAA family ATPase [Solirubrobacteraceae bacterium]|nr:AAA family ATPase [Solirubrobacteraceae bacterium]